MRIGYYISASCTISGRTYCYGFSVRSKDDQSAQSTVSKKFEKYMRKWMQNEIEQEPDFKVDTRILEKHYL